MNTRTLSRRLLLGQLGALWGAMAWPAQAQTSDVQPADAASLWAEGEVRRIDPAAGKITLRHGHIPDLDMPPMTMVFQVRERALLQGLQVGQRVRFRAQQAGGAYFVTEIKPTP